MAKSTSKRRTPQMLAELKRLADEASDNLYKRIALADQVLDDVEWIAENFGGSDLKAADALASEYFRDLGGFISLGKLRAMYREITADEWKECRYNVAAVETLYDDRTKEEKQPSNRVAWKKLAEERAQRIADLEKQVKQLLEANGNLREENTELRAKVARLEGRLEEMDRRNALAMR